MCWERENFNEEGMKPDGRKVPVDVFELSGNYALKQTGTHSTSARNVILDIYMKH